MSLAATRSDASPATGSDAQRRRHRRLMLALSWLGLFFVYAVTVSHSWMSPDVASAEVGAYTIATTGTPWVDEALSAEQIEATFGSSADDSVGLFTRVNSDNDHTVITRTPGVIAVGIPAYWLAEKLGLTPSDQPLSPVPGALVAAALAATSVLLLLLALDGLVDARILMGGALALAFATPYWSVLADALWTHGLTVLGIAGMAWSARRERWWLLGMFGGIAIWGRLHVAVIVAVMGLGLAIWRRRPGIAIVVGATSSAFLAGCFIWGRWTYGVWSIDAASGGYNHVATAGSREITLVDHLTNGLGYLVSPEAGIFVWTPVILALVPAVVRSWRSTPDWTRLLALGGLVYLMIQAYLNKFHGGNGFWGNRLGLETLTCLVPLLLCSAARVTRFERVVVVALVALQAGVIALGAVFDASLREGTMWESYEPLMAWQESPAATTLVISIAAGVAVVVARVLSRGAVDDSSSQGQPNAEPAA